MSETLYYHGTDRYFDVFDPALLHSREGGHLNGVLGVWVATEPALASRFGSQVLVVSPAGHRVKTIEISELSELARRGDKEDDGGLDLHRRYAEQIRAEHDVLAIEETSGEVHMAILLHPEQVRIVERVPSESIEDPEASRNRPGR